MANKKKVLVDIYYLLVAQTGVRTYTEEFVKQILGNKDAAHQYVIAPNYKKTINNHYFRGRTSRFRNLLFQFLYLIWKQIRLPYIAYVNNVDVIFSPDYVSPLCKTSALKITVIHDAFFWDDPQNYNKWWLAYFKRSILLGLRGRSLVLTISSHARSRLQSFLPLNQTFEIAYQGSKFDDIKFDPEPVLRKFQLQQGKYFLFLGVLEKRKNLLTLINAYHLFLQANPLSDTKLVLAGQRGPRASLDDYPSIMKLINELHLARQVVLTGYISIEEAKALYSNALCFVFPSLNEGFGLPVVEAFSQRLPVIVSANGALCEIGGDAVLTFESLNSSDLCQKLLLISGNAELRNEMIRKGTERLALFSWSSFFSSVEKIISKHA